MPAAHHTMLPYVDDYHDHHHDEQHHNHHGGLPNGAFLEDTSDPAG